MMVALLAACGGGGGGDGTPPAGGGGSTPEVRPTGPTTTLKVSRFGQGRIVDASGSLVCAESSCAKPVEAASTVTMSAQPAQGWAFSHWVGCDVVTDGRCQVRMAEERTVHPYFTRTTPMRLKSDVVVLDTANATALLRQELTLFVFSSNATQVAALRPGSVFVSTVGEGYARRVSSISVLNGGLIYVDTRDAALQDVVAEGTILAKAGSFQLAPEVAQGEGGNVNLARRRAETSVQVSLTQPNGDGVTGSVDLVVDPDVALDFDTSGIQEFKFIVDATIKPKLTLKAVEPLRREWRREIFRPRKFAPFNVGPVIFVPTLSAEAVASLNLSIAAHLGGEYEAAGAAGVHWVRGQGQRSVGRLASTSRFDLIGNLADEATVEGSVGFELKGLLRVWGFQAGPYVAAEAGLTAKVIDKVSRDASCPLRFLVEAGADLKVGGEAKVLGQDFDIHSVVASLPSKVFSDLQPEQCPDTEPPTVPGALSVVAGSPGELNLSWQASTDRSKHITYEIVRDGQVVATTGRTAFADLGLAADTSYCYTIVAIDKKGNRSPASNAVCGRTPTATPGAAGAGGVQATALSSSAIQVNWSPDPSGRARSYIVTMGGVEVGRTTGTSLDVLRLSRNVEYCFAVIAVNEGGKSAPSATVCARTRNSAEWAMQMRCRDADYYVVTQEIDLDPQDGGVVNVVGNANDYTGEPMAYQLSGSYNAAVRQLDGRVLWSFANSSNIREDVFRINLSRNDTGDVPMEQVQVTGCDAVIRFGRLQ